MKKILFCLPLFLFGFLSCNFNDSITPPSNSEKGNLQLQIDKVNAPENVVLVEATLSREGFDSLTASLNLLSDSTADILLEEVAAGTWHLQVDAKDSTGVVLYTGETDVNVLAGFTTPVYLVLEPTGHGIGSIYIYVTWGQPPHSWTDFVNNPVFGPSGSYWDYNRVTEPEIIFDDGEYRMYYTGQGDVQGSIGLAFSTDGINWTNSSNNPVLLPGSYGSWDQSAVAAPTVIKDETGYKLYYHGWSDEYGNWDIGLATSTDGINRVKYPTPVMYGSSGWEYQLGPSSIIKINGTYYLYYLGRNLPTLKDWISNIN